MAAAASACGDAGCGPHCSSSAGAAGRAIYLPRRGLRPVRQVRRRRRGRRGAGRHRHVRRVLPCPPVREVQVRRHQQRHGAPHDAVLLAFSGGPASRVALQFIHEMQAKAIQSWETSNSQALPVFGVGVAFVDESSVFSPKPKHEIETAVEDIRSIVSSLSPGEKAVHIASLGDMFASRSDDGVGRLREVVGMVGDETGKDDFLQRLRMLLLQKIALENGYTKIMLGSCASGIACHVLSATVKGHGYSLPADVQYVDTRWDVPLVLPLRDCLAQELSLTL